MVSILTAVLGIAGSFVAGFAGQALGWYGAGQGAGFIGSVIGAAVLLFDSDAVCAELIERIHRPVPVAPSVAEI